MDAMLPSEPEGPNKPIRRGDFERLQDQLVRRPLSGAPPGVREAVWRLWTCCQHLFPSPLPIACLMGTWTRERGLSESDARAILDRFLDPAYISRFRFAADLTAEMAAAALVAIRKRRQEGEQARVAAERAEWESRKADPPEVAKLSDALKDIGRMPD